MKKRVSFYIHQPNASQPMFNLIREGNELLTKRDDIMLGLFFDVSGMIPDVPNFTLMQHKHLWGYDTNIICLHILTAYSPPYQNIGRKLFYYVQDLDWIYEPRLVSAHREVYANNKIDLIARSKSHFNVLEKVWKTPVATIEDFNHEQLAKTIDEYCV